MTPKLHHSITPLLLLCMLCASVVQTQAQTAAPPLFQRLDKNGDGKLTADEATDAAAFKAADKDADGSVTREELQAYVASRAAAAKKTPAPPAAPAVQVPVLKGGLFERTLVPGFSEMRDGMNGVAVADLNADGRKDIVATTTGRTGTREEYPQKEVFDAVDANRDGQATLEEVRAFYQKRRGTPANPQP